MNKNNILNVYINEKKEMTFDIKESLSDYEKIKIITALSKLWEAVKEAVVNKNE